MSTELEVNPGLLCALQVVWLVVEDDGEWLRFEV
jgi:hypothetical protein